LGWYGGSIDCSRQSKHTHADTVEQKITEQTNNRIYVYAGRNFIFPHRRIGIKSTCTQQINCINYVYNVRVYCNF